MSGPLQLLDRCTFLLDWRGNRCGRAACRIVQRGGIRRPRCDEHVAHTAALLGDGDPE